MHNAMSLVTKGFLCPTLEQTVFQVQLPPNESQNLLVKALQLPLPSSMTEAKGIHQSDIIIRTALTMAIADMRANPWLLDHVFASLIQDEQTAATYGEKEVKKAKDWFLSTNIPIVLDYRFDEVEKAMVSISLVESAEAENTLADVHYIPQEEVESSWPPLTASFTPTAFHPATGIMKLPTKIADSLIIVPGMLVVDAVGRTHEITEVTAKNTIVITAGTVANFTNAVIKGKKPRLLQEIESLSFRETYRIGCHVHGEPFHLTWLHSIISFCLLRYKQALLEARGFERSTMSSTPFAKNEALGAENYWTRFINVIGYVRNYWPKALNERLQSVGVTEQFNESAPGLKISKVGQVAKKFKTDPSQTDPAWMAQDGLGMSIDGDDE